MGGQMPLIERLIAGKPTNKGNLTSLQLKQWCLGKPDLTVQIWTSASKSAQTEAERNCTKKPSKQADDDFYHFH